MMNKSFALSLAFALVSSMLAGCAGQAEGGKGPETAEAKQGDGYGYEMLPLTLSPGAAPQGDALMPNGRVAPEEIVRQAIAQVPEIQKCQDAAKARGAAAEAKVVVKLKFEETGALRSATVEDPKPADAALGECVSHALSAIKPPATKSGPFEVVYPVELH